MGNKPHSIFPSFSFHCQIQNLVLSSLKNAGKSERWEAHWSGCWVNTSELKGTWWVPWVCCRLLAAMYVHYQFVAAKLPMWPYLCMECTTWWLKGSVSWPKNSPSTRNVAVNGQRVAAAHKFTLPHIPSTTVFCISGLWNPNNFSFCFRSFLLNALNTYYKSLFFGTYSQYSWTRR